MPGAIDRRASNNSHIIDDAAENRATPLMSGINIYGSSQESVHGFRLGQLAEAVV